MKEYSTFHKAAGFETHHQMQFDVLSRTLVGGGSYFSAEAQSKYSTAPADSVIVDLVWKTIYSKNDTVHLFFSYTE